MTYASPKVRLVEELCGRGFRRNSASARSYSRKQSWKPVMTTGSHLKVRDVAPTSRVMVVAIMVSMVAFLDGTVVNLALPAMERDLGGGLALQQGLSMATSWRWRRRFCRAVPSRICSGACG
jgi:hypothetical protein